MDLSRFFDMYESLIQDEVETTHDGEGLKQLMDICRRTIDERPSRPNDTRLTTLTPYATALAMLASSCELLIDDENQLTKVAHSIDIAMQAVEPQDQIEAMLSAQMVACHHQVMEFLRLTLINRSSAEHAKTLTNIAAKFMRTYVLQMEALSKYRRKGEQTVRVEHVSVHAGGQAIVGTVGMGGGQESGT